MVGPSYGVHQGVPRGDVRRERQPAGGGVAVRGVLVLDDRRYGGDTGGGERPEGEQIPASVGGRRGRGMVGPSYPVDEDVPRRYIRGISQGAVRGVALRDIL